MILGHGGQKVKRRESSVCPGHHVSPLATKVSLQFPDCHQHKPDNPPVHFCSSAFKYAVIPNILTNVHARTKLTPWQPCWVCFPWKRSKVCRWRGKNEREKTDSRTKQQAKRNRISSALHPTRSQSRLTTARAKDAQARAKFFSSKRRPPIVPVWRSVSLSDSHMDAVVCSFNRNQKKNRMFAQLPSFYPRDDTKIWFWQTVDHFSRACMLLFTHCPLGK